MYLSHDPYFQIGFIEIVMNEKAEDISDESKKNHSAYYKSLNKTIENIQKEKLEETEPTIIKHLNSRIEVVDLDKKESKICFQK
jgi:hypothetical protein